MTPAAQRHGAVDADAARTRDRRRDAPAPAIAHPRRRSAGLSGRSVNTMALVGGLAVAAWLILVFGTALARSDALEREAEVVRAENLALLERIAAGRTEVELIQTQAFLSIQARAFGMGEAGERPFALALDAPPPAAIVPLGEGPLPDEPTTPLDEWLELLFG